MRCLGDEIPIDPLSENELIERLASELLYREGSARFQRYRQALESRLEYLKASSVAKKLADELTEGLNADEEAVRLRALNSLSQLDLEPDRAIQLLKEALSDGYEQVIPIRVIDVTTL